MINIIAAVSNNGVVGLGSENKLPFYYPEDLQHFKKLTLNSTVIMGRKTFESIGRPLPKRKNIVISSQNNIHEGVEVFQSLENAITNYTSNNIWLIGGYNIWSEGLSFVDEIHLTITPDIIQNSNPIKFPWINPLKYNISSVSSFDNSTLKYCIYSKK